MADDNRTEYWFHIPDVLPVAVQALPPSLVDGDRPALRLVAQGRLRYLVNNTVPPTRVEAFYAGSVARVYALGYGPAPSRPTDRTDHRDGDPVVLADRRLLHGPDGALLRDMSGAQLDGRDWLVVTVAAGTARWEIRALPRPRPPARWIPVQVELAGVAGGYPGEIVDNRAWRGWCLPRFTREVAARIVADLRRLPALPVGMTPLRLLDQPGADAPPHTVGVDEHGFYRLGAGAWPWVSRTLLPDGRLHLFTAPSYADASALPATAQEAFAGPHALMWLVDGDLVTRPVYQDDDPKVEQHLRCDGMLLEGIGYLDVEEDPVHPEWDSLQAVTAMQMRAVEHLLRLTATATPTGPV